MEAQLKTRKEAVRAGAMRYYTGQPCRNGHVAERYVKGTKCIVCVGNYRDEWRRNNPERFLITRKAYHRTTEAKQGALRRKWENPKRHWASAALSRAKIRALETGIAFELTHKDVYDIIPDVCPIFGIEFTFFGNGRLSQESPSLDRIKPELGYVPGNIAVISQKANQIKSAYTSKEIYAVGDWLHEIEKTVKEDERKTDD